MRESYSSYSSTQSSKTPMLMMGLLISMVMARYNQEEAPVIPNWIWMGNDSRAEVIT